MAKSHQIADQGLAGEISGVETPWVPPRDGEKSAWTSLLKLPLITRIQMNS